MTNPTCEDTPLVKHRDLKNGYHSLTFGPYHRAEDCRPGQFVHIQLPEAPVFFRRAFSVAGVQAETQQVEILLKVSGRGSAALARMRRGDRVNLLGPLGTPFTLAGKSETTIVVAGGIGVPPMLFLTSEMLRRGYRAQAIEFYFGGRSAADVVERTRIKRLGIRFYPVTEDGSLGKSGLVTDQVENRLRAKGNGERLRLYACGPEGMLQVVNGIGLKHDVPGQLSLEAPMPCGIGICLGCVVRLSRGGYARVCCDGPVFDIGEVRL